MSPQVAAFVGTLNAVRQGQEPGDNARILFLLMRLVQTLISIVAESDDPSTVSYTHATLFLFVQGKVSKEKSPAEVLIRTFLREVMVPKFQEQSLSAFGWIPHTVAAELEKLPPDLLLSLSGCSSSSGGGERQTPVKVTTC